MSTVDDLSKEILADLVHDFRAKNLGSDALSNGYEGPSIAAIGMKYCAEEQYSKVDFDLALKQLEESKFVNSGPMVPYENTPGSQIVFMGMRSKREFVYLKEKGYKAAQKFTPKPKLAAPSSGADADRKFARLAIDEARKSLPENDGRPHPWVGAVVVKDGKVLGTAHRGEVPGNHAEFVALEKNLPDVAVTGATVYTTLEPCTTRTPPKIPCVDRLIERKVARVVIGILDPDDRIRGKGQRKLSNAGIETALFPHDLAMEVEELNREFTRFCEKQTLTSQTHSGNSFAPAGGLKPLVVPLRYGPSPPSAGKHAMGHHGLIVANHGEPAYDVSVSTAKIPIGTSELRFEGSKPVFTKADGEAFFIGTIELAPHYGTLGSGLFEEMRKFHVDEITVKLIYKDAENRWYETIGKIERDVGVSGGLSVRYGVRQERTNQQNAVSLEWPKDLGAYVATSSEEIPLFPPTLSGFRSEDGKDFWGKPFSTRGSVRIGQGGDWEGIWKFPNTMNGCSHGVFMIRWRSADPNIRVHSVVAYSAAVVSRSEVKTGIFGYMSGTNCDQPMFKFADAPYRVQGTLLVDVFYELKFWQAAP
jgi:pyrimidine deaminase RibD-like protein